MCIETSQLSDPPRLFYISCPLSLRYSKRSVSGPRFDSVESYFLSFFPSLFQLDFSPGMGSIPGRAHFFPIPLFFPSFSPLFYTSFFPSFFRPLFLSSNFFFPFSPALLIVLFFFPFFFWFSFLSFLPLFYSPSYFLLFSSYLFLVVFFFPSHPLITSFFSIYFTSLTRGLLSINKENKG